MASKKFFIDSTVLYSFIDRADPNHFQSVKLLEQLAVQPANLYTSIQSIEETYKAINGKLGASLGLEFLQAMTETTIEVLYPQKQDFLASFRQIRENRNTRISLNEAQTAILMQKKGIGQIITFSYWHNLFGTQSFLA